MPDSFQKPVENKLILLFLLYQMDMSLSIAQIVDFTAECGYMSYFECQQYMAELVSNGFIDDEVNESNTTMYTITPDGEDALRMFSKQIPYSKRTAICEYVSVNKRRIKREFEVVANYFYNSENDYVVKCGVYEDETPLMEVNISVVSKEQAKAIKRNWRNNVTELYGKILSVMIDEDLGQSMGKSLQQDFENNHVNNDGAIDDEE